MTVDSIFSSQKWEKRLHRFRIADAWRWPIRLPCLGAPWTRTRTQNAAEPQPRHRHPALRAAARGIDRQKGGPAGPCSASPRGRSPRPRSWPRHRLAARVDRREASRSLMSRQLWITLSSYVQTVSLTTHEAQTNMYYAARPLVLSLRPVVGRQKEDAITMRVQAKAKLLEGAPRLQAGQGYSLAAIAVESGYRRKLD